MATLAILGVVFACIVILLYLHCKHKFNYWKSRGVPHKKPAFLFGNILNAALSPYPIGLYISKLCGKFGNSPYFGFYSFTRPFLILKDPDIIKHILVKDFAAFPNRLEDAPWEPILNNTLFAMKSPKWKELRTQLTPVFSSAKIRLMMSLIIECGKNMEEYLTMKVGENLEVKEICSKFMADVISSCAFGINGNSFQHENSDLRKHGEMVLPNTIICYLKMAAYFFTPAAVRLLKFSLFNMESVQFFKYTYRTVIKQRTQDEVGRKDLLDILSKNPFFCHESNDDLLIANPIVFFIAGFETTGTAISLALHELGVNPNIQSKLRAEIASVIGRHGGLTFEAVNEMKYLHMVISETLRKYPVTPIIPREATEDYEIRKTGLIIEKGTQIIISHDALHKNPKYFPNPEVFDPERFSESNVHSINSYTYLPFGKGPRNCIGERFALLTAKVGIIYALTKFMVHTNSNTTEPMEFSRSLFLTAKHGVNLTFTRI
ncbi:cytochrome P450 6k1-like isoform X1 [Photinus pyralis]|uniref:cytochrome P450 6k1-like isoform X1 n=1 Tax=Photinus pyralis TaxID=7054 RepID=UPI001267506F|nr:cytochrome P450 6k1-like isoform X1 [Photinus pyralis]XP_031349562.1 cytochrome P450 6k1-like isoform X1 [Photinus pyralis]